MESAVVVLAVLVIAYGAVSKKLESTVITGPIVFLSVGLLVGTAGLDILRLDVGGEGVAVLAEVTLALLLFTDAARIDLPRLRRDASLPARMLGSLPVVMALGVLAAILLLPELTLFEAAVLAAVLAPTDAALGQAVVTDERIPLRVRQTLNVESGLNDGIVLPFVTIFLGLAGASEGVESFESGLRFVGEQVGYGVGMGLLVGCTGAWVIDRASSRGWMTSGFQQLATLACAITAFVAAEAVGGNGFIAAYVGGMAFGVLAQQHCTGVYEFAEEEGTLLTLLVFALLGATLAPALVQPLDLATVVYIALSLTVVRMLPIALSLVGTGLRRDTVAFLGWFGPRGLASVLFALLVVERAELRGGDRIVSVALWTVVASVYAHGLTAVPLAARYAARLRGMDDEPMPEMQQTTAFPTR